MKYELTIDDERLVTRLKELNKLPKNVDCLSGFNLLETVDENQMGGVSVVLGYSPTGRRGRKPQSIPVTRIRRDQPRIVITDGGATRIYEANVREIRKDDEIEYEIVRHDGSDSTLRIIRTGLLEFRGSTVQDMMAIAASGRKLGYHGAFPLTAEAATLIGEGIDVAIENQSKVISDVRFGRVNNMVGIPKHREVAIKAVVGGPILVGQIDGTLKIHELRREGWKVHDVTDVPKWVQKFMDLAETDIEYMAELDRDKKRRENDKRRFRVVKPPVDHPDA